MVEYSTDGAREKLGVELVVAVQSKELSAEVKKFLATIESYGVEKGAALKPGETLQYGYWMIRLCPRGSEVLDIQELAPEGEGFVDGASYTLRSFAAQRKACQIFSSQFSPPKPDSLVVISDGVLESNPGLQGVRYPSPSHMSGWWLTTDAYDGDIESLRTVHCKHVTHQRPQLLQYLALYYGFRFNAGEKFDAWFDQSVRDQSSG